MCAAIYKLKRSEEIEDKTVPPATVSSSDTVSVERILKESTNKLKSSQEEGKIHYTGKFEKIKICLACASVIIAGFLSKPLTDYIADDLPMDAFLIINGSLYILLTAAASFFSGFYALCVYYKNTDMLGGKVATLAWLTFTPYILFVLGYIGLQAIAVGGYLYVEALSHFTGSGTSFLIE